MYGKCPLHNVAWMYSKKALLVKVCTCSFPLVSFVCWDRRTKSSEEQQALASFWSSAQTHWGRGDDLVVGCWLEAPKEEHSLCFNVCFSDPGTGGRISSGASPSCCAYILHWCFFLFFPLQVHSLMASDLAQLPQQRPIMQKPVDCICQVRLAWGAGRLPKADTSGSFCSLNLRIYAES